MCYIFFLKEPNRYLFKIFRFHGDVIILLVNRLFNITNIILFLYFKPLYSNQEEENELFLNSSGNLKIMFNGNSIN